MPEVLAALRRPRSSLLKTLAAFTAVFLATPGGAAPAPMRVGVNLAPLTYFTDHTTIARTGGAFLIKTKGGGQRYADRAELDADGYLLKIPEDAASVQFAIEVDPAKIAPTQRYVLLYTGEARFTMSNARTVATAPGRVTFEVTNAAANRVTLSIWAMAKRVTAMALVREDQVAAYRAGARWQPEMLQLAQQYSALRYMDWGATNGSKVKTWAQRVQPGARTWQGSQGGVPIEAMIDFANATHTDMYVNVPLGADDDFVQQMLTLVRERLNPALSVKVELSNEVWNQAFPQFAQAREATKLLTTPADAWDYEVGYGFRAGQVAALALHVFAGQEHRLGNVIGLRGNPAREQRIVDWAQKGAGMPLAKAFRYNIFPAYYGQFGGNKADMPLILQWARSGEAGLSAAFDHLAHGGGGITVDQSVPMIVKACQTYVARGRARGLQAIVYEGGVHNVATRFPVADRPEAMAFFGRINNDPRTGTMLYTPLLKGCAQAGVVEFYAYASSGGNGASGYWGNVDSVRGDTDTPRERALRSFSTTMRTPQSIDAHGDTTAKKR